jgi:hypothetical protein
MNEINAEEVDQLQMRTEIERINFVGKLQDGEINDVINELITEMKVPESLYLKVMRFTCFMVYNHYVNEENQNSIIRVDPTEMYWMICFAWCLAIYFDKGSITEITKRVYPEMFKRLSGYLEDLWKRETISGRRKSLKAQLLERFLRIFIFRDDAPSKVLSNIIFGTEGLPRKNLHTWWSRKQFRPSGLGFEELEREKIKFEHYFQMFFQEERKKHANRNYYETSLDPNNNENGSSRKRPRRGLKVLILWINCHGSIPMTTAPLPKKEKRHTTTVKRSPMVKKNFDVNLIRITPQSQLLGKKVNVPSSIETFRKITHGSPGCVNYAYDTMQCIRRKLYGHQPENIFEVFKDSLKTCYPLNGALQRKRNTVLAGKPILDNGELIEHDSSKSMMLRTYFQKLLDDEATTQYVFKRLQNFAVVPTTTTLLNKYFSVNNISEPFSRSYDDAKRNQSINVIKDTVGKFINSSIYTAKTFTTTQELLDEIASMGYTDVTFIDDSCNVGEIITSSPDQKYELNNEQIKQLIQHCASHQIYF